MSENTFAQFGSRYKRNTKIFLGSLSLRVSDCDDDQPDLGCNIFREDTRCLKKYRAI